MPSKLTPKQKRIVREVANSAARYRKMRKNPSLYSGQYGEGLINGAEMALKQMAKDLARWWD